MEEMKTRKRDFMTEQGLWHFIPLVWWYLQSPKNTPASLAELCLFLIMLCRADTKGLFRLYVILLTRQGQFDRLISTVLLPWCLLLSRPLSLPLRGGSCCSLRCLSTSCSCLCCSSFCSFSRSSCCCFMARSSCCNLREEKDMRVCNSFRLQRHHPLPHTATLSTFGTW